MTVRRRAALLFFPVALLAMVSGLLFTVGTAADPAGAAPSACTPRLLVLSAMPLELDPILAQASVDPGTQVYLNNRAFVTGTLEGNPVIMGLTGIGPENAMTTTTDAFAHYRCDGASEISGVVFSGTSGGDYIGDVFVPDQWTENGTTFVPSTPSWVDLAQSAAASATLEQTTPTGDPACVCGLADGVQTPVTVEHTPVVEVGGTGLTTDPFGGRMLPCAPAGSDVFGCVPCREMDQSQLAQAEAFATGIVPFAEPSFFTNYLEETTPPGTYVSQDNETAVVAGVAAANDVDFIGFRGASDGPGNDPGTGGDPLMLPGYPAQFLVYRQLAADNAASVALAFLHALAAQG